MCIILSLFSLLSRTRCCEEFEVTARGLFIEKVEKCYGILI